jgi:serine/threonine protein kinase
LGQGGNGVVWLANDLALERLLAFKMPRRDERGPRQSQMDTIAEACRVAGLNIAGVVPVFDVLQLDDELAIVFKYIDGDSLADLIRHERISAERTARICQQVAETLSEAHLRDMIHRDIKPGNILLDSAGNAWISDFGLAILEHEQFRDRGLEVGTLAYMPPEQLSGGAHLVDARGDIYGLGVVMFELLTGRLPFVRTDDRDYREAILLRQSHAPRSIEWDVPQELERICLRCLATDPADRYATASDLAADLGRWLQSRASGLRPQEAKSTDSQPAVSPRDPDQLGVLNPLHVGGWKRHLALALISAFVLGTIGIATVAGLNALRSTTPTPAIARLLETDEARFPTTASLESFDWSFNAKTIPQAPFQELATGEFLARRDNLVFVGS